MRGYHRSKILTLQELMFCDFLGIKSSIGLARKRWSLVRSCVIIYPNCNSTAQYEVHRYVALFHSHGLMLPVLNERDMSYPQYSCRSARGVTHQGVASRLLNAKV